MHGIGDSKELVFSVTPRAAESQEGGVGTRRFRLPRVKMWMGKVASDDGIDGGKMTREVIRVVEK